MEYTQQKVSTVPETTDVNPSKSKSHYVSIDSEAVLLERIGFLLQQQNKLLEHTNKLMESQNSVLQTKQSTLSPHVYEEFVENLYQDEIRNNFLVTSQRKKIWNVQIGLLNELDRICKKYNIRYFISDGTLLGAIRHGGFIPWDSDSDVVMLRPDYEKLIRVLDKEIKYPYFADIWYNYRLEREPVFHSKEYQHLQPVTIEEEQKTSWLEWPKIKIRDCRTSFIHRPLLKHVNQGIWLDIFPLDSVPPFQNEQQAIHFEISRELLAAAINPTLILYAMQNKQRLLISYEKLKKVLALPFHQRGRLAENYALNTFTPSEYVARTVYYLYRKNSGEPLYPPHKLEWFKEAVYVPFEKTKMPAPVGYEGFLKNYYGDWHVPVIEDAHVSIEKASADIPYTEYYKNLS